MDKRVTHLVTLVNNLGADIEDKAEVYQYSTEAASGKLQAFDQIKQVIKALRKDPTMDKKTLAALAKKLKLATKEAEIDLMCNNAKSEAFKDTVSYLDQVRKKLV